MQTLRRHPEWLKVRLPSLESYHRIKSLVRGAKTNTVCEEARCPNIGECWSKGVATFMILGDTCTRACRYCHVKTGWPKGVIDEGEPAKVAGIVKQLGLRYVVITSVDRDDLADGGSGLFAATVREIHEKVGCTVEVLTPDYTEERLRTVLLAEPEVFGHNIEAARSCFSKVRSKGNYEKSLAILSEAKKIRPNQKTKSGMMVGFGETVEDVFLTMKDLRDHYVDFLSIGQYLPPTAKHYPLSRYYHPDEFRAFAEAGKEMGFLHVEAGPLVRSSFRADKLIHHV